MSDQAAIATARRHHLAAAALLISLISFTAQTELLSRVSAQGYSKPVFVMYLTHSMVSLLFPLQVLVLKVCKPKQSFKRFWKKHTTHLRQTAQQIQQANGYSGSVYKYFAVVTVILAVSLNIAGASWYIAIGLTTASDVTAIYNCSIFYAYAFSVCILHETLSWAKIISVVGSALGVVIVAYGGSNNISTEARSHRMIGNLIIAAGSVLYGLYEVLAKKLSSPPQEVSAKKQAAFANLTGALIGVGTLVLMWPVILILHWTGVETLEMPTKSVLVPLIWSITMNVTFIGSFLVLMSLTSPVFGSVSSLLATFLVPIVDYVLRGTRITLAEVFGGLVILLSFVLMTWASLAEMEEDGKDEDEDEFEYEEVSEQGQAEVEPVNT